MICPKCGAEISDNANRCGNCGLKVNIRCPECNTVNPFGVKYCKNCGFDFLITCSVCGSTNIYLSKECRKCHSVLEKPKKKTEINTTKIKINSEVEVVNAFSSGTESYNLPNVNFEQTQQNKEPQQESVPDKKEEEKVIPLVEDVIQEPEQVKEDEITPQIFNIEENIDIDEIPLAETVETEDELINIPTTEPKMKENISIVEEETDNKEQKQEEVVAETTELTEEINNDEKEFEEIFNDADDTLLEECKEEIPEHHDFQEETENEIEIQTPFVEKIVKIVTKSLKKHIIAVAGEEGCGKTAVLNKVSTELEDKGYMALYGSCTPLVQITSFGFFQDAFLRMMGFPPYTNSIEKFTKDFKKSDYAKLFSSMSQSDLNLFINMLYPSQRDDFENILTNKKKMFSVIEKALKSFLTDNNLIIIIDNFELLDGASYDFIMHILKKGFFNNRLKLLVAYSENKAIQSYFDLDSDEEQIFETVLLNKLDKEEILTAVNNNLMFNIQDVIEKEYLDELIAKSDGNAIRLEQEIALLIDTGYITIEKDKVLTNNNDKPSVSPITFEDLIKLRLNAMTPAARNILYMAAIMGYRFATGILCQASAIPAETTASLLGYLIQELYTTHVDDYTCEFKNLTLWKLIYKEAKNDLLYKDNSEKLYQTLKQLILSSNLQKLISCTEALTKNESYLIWQNTASIAAKLGDTNLYIIAQKQCLKILEEQENDDSDEIKSQIYEEIGKLLCEKSPNEAVTYLANVLDSEIKNNNIRKVIDVSGYFVKSCYLSGNYFGVAEAVDNIVKQLDESTSVSSADLALVKTRKLRALLNIGNSEQIINIANEEILPVLEQNIDSEKNDTQYRNLIINAWLLTKIVLAKAYGIQGNIQINEEVNDLRAFLDKYRNNSDYYLVQTDIIDAFAHTVSGDINKSNEILNHISSAYKDRKMETNLLAEWNLVNIINRVLLEQNNDLKSDLFELAAFANNINEHFVKNIVKLILGYVIKEEGDAVKALEIYNEEVTYFAKEKVAIGALLSWALIVQTSIEDGDEVRAMDTANKSLEIAKSPKINNYFFIIYFKRILAQLYMSSGDLEAAKMYLEESIVIARKNNLQYQLIELYIDYANYTLEVMKAKHIYASNNLKLALDMYSKALQLAKDLKLSNMSDKAYRARAGFKTFCQLNSIEL